MKQAITPNKAEATKDQRMSQLADNGLSHDKDLVDS